MRALFADVPGALSRTLAVADEKTGLLQGGIGFWQGAHLFQQHGDAVTFAEGRPKLEVAHGVQAVPADLMPAPRLIKAGDRSAQLGGHFVDAFTLQGRYAIIGIGAWLGTIMLFNVWVLIWPNQKKVLGLVQADDAAKAKAVPGVLRFKRS